MQANPKAHGASQLRGLVPDLLDFFGHRSWRLAPGQDHFDLFGGQILGRLRGSSEIQRRTWLLDRRIE
ncbi:hypothetical protein D3C71_1902880 [compost metagenome]